MTLRSTLIALALTAAALSGCACESSDTTQDTASETTGSDTGSADTGSDTGSADTGSDTGSDTALPELLPISIDELKAALPTKDFLLINVHIPYQGEIAGTNTNISYLDIDALVAYIGDNLETKVVVYCMSNHMSIIAGEALVALGYRHVQFLDGGMSGWTKAGNALINVAD